MSRGQRPSDRIAAQLDVLLNIEVDLLKHTLLASIKESQLFQELTGLASKATQEDNERLAHALLEAKLVCISSEHLIDMYARRFIYPPRTKPCLLFDKSQEPH